VPSDRLRQVLRQATASLGALLDKIDVTWVTGTERNISSLMGMTMIVGIVTEAGVFYFAELTHEASHDAASLIRAGTLRMRPILMTSIIAVLALLPFALGLGGTAMQTPLAISIISGLCLAVPWCYS
jgi:multidrug efflux pump subunit AcrB